MDPIHRQRMCQIFLDLDPGITIWYQIMQLLIKYHEFVTHRPWHLVLPHQSWWLEGLVPLACGCKPAWAKQLWWWNVQVCGRRCVVNLLVTTKPESLDSLGVWRLTNKSVPHLPVIPVSLPMESLVLQQHAPGDSTSISTCSLDLWFLIVSHSGSSGLTPLGWEVLSTRKSYFRLAKHRINISKTLLRFMLTHVVLRWICFLVCSVAMAVKIHSRKWQVLEDVRSHWLCYVTVITDTTAPQLLDTVRITDLNWITLQTSSCLFSTEIPGVSAYNYVIVAHPGLTWQSRGPT